MRRTTRLSGLVITSCTLLVACGGSAEPEATSSTVSATAESPAETTSSTLSTFPPPVPVSAAPSDSTRLMTDVRASAQETGDRIVFEFAGATPPGYVIEYVEPPIVGDGSDDPVPLQGSEVLSARFVHASTVELTSGMSQSYTGPSRFAPQGTTTIKEVARVSDFEAQLIWGIGTTSRTPFTVTEMTGPARVVIDFQR